MPCVGLTSSSPLKAELGQSTRLGANGRLDHLAFIIAAHGGFLPEPVSVDVGLSLCEVP